MPNGPGDPSPSPGTARPGIDRARLAGAAPGEDLRDRDVTVHPVPALHGIGGDGPVVYEFSPADPPALALP